jgi:hypothetical protein
MSELFCNIDLIPLVEGLQMFTVHTSKEKIVVTFGPKDKAKQ